MTWEQFAIEFLTRNGMFKQQAEEVVRLAKLDPRFRPLDVPWDAYTGDQAVGVRLQINLKRFALGWIDANLPEAWFRVMFDDED